MPQSLNKVCQKGLVKRGSRSETRVVGSQDGSVMVTEHVVNSLATSWASADLVHGARSSILESFDEHTTGIIA